MRLNECCQLLTSDVRKIDGVWCIIISEDQEDGGDLGDLKRVKTDAGERFVPVHPELERIGFLNYVAEMREKKKSERLFPDLPSGAHGYYSDPFSKWFSGEDRFLDKLGLRNKLTTFHSLRHNYRDTMREARLSRDVVLQLGGWAGGKTDDDYGKGLKASTLYREIEKVAYPGLDLSHLYLT
jgi:integrase